MTQVSEHLLGELLVHELVRLERHAPFKSVDEHRLGIRNIEVSIYQYHGIKIP